MMGSPCMRILTRRTGITKQKRTTEPSRIRAKGPPKQQKMAQSFATTTILVEAVFKEIFEGYLGRISHITS